jgi:hypothetical protein
MLDRMGKQTRRLTLELDLDSDSIAGRIGDGHETQTFFGWLEFAAALRSALESTPAHPVGRSVIPRDDAGHADARIASRPRRGSRDDQTAG